MRKVNKVTKFLITYVYVYITYIFKADVKFQTVVYVLQFVCLKERQGKNIVKSFKNLSVSFTYGAFKTSLITNDETISINVQHLSKNYYFCYQNRQKKMFSLSLQCYISNIKSV